MGAELPQHVIRQLKQGEGPLCFHPFPISIAPTPPFSAQAKGGRKSQESCSFFPGFIWDNWVVG